MKQRLYHRFGLRMIRFILAAVAVAMILSANPISLAQSGGTIGYGSKVYGTVSAANAIVTYSFSGEQGDFVDITADSWMGTLDVRLELVAPDGVIVSSSTQNTATAESLGAHLSVFLPQAGIYVLRLSGDGDTTGDFLLSLLGRTAATATSLHYGEAVDVIIASAAPSQFFTFEAEDCPTTLVVSARSEGQPDALPFVIKLRDQRGQTVTQLYSRHQQLEDWVTVEANSGRYEVEVLAAAPDLSGALRLLVTCSGDNPGCTGTAALSGAVCPSCPPLDEWADGGGCPDLGLAAYQDPDNPAQVTVTWNSMLGADGYAVYVTGNLVGGGEVYLTHAEWVPGDPLRFEWILPTAGYEGYTFKLQVLVGGVLLCTDEVAVNLMERQQYVCPDLGLALSMVDPATETVRLDWFGMEDVDGYQLTVSGSAGGEETTLYTSEVLPPGVTSHEYTLPDGYTGFHFTLRLVGAPIDCSDDLVIQRQQIPPGDMPCAIRADRDGVAVRVGPGTSRSQFVYLLPGIEYTVVGQAADETGALWWQLDKTQFTGHEAVTSLWVAQADVVALGDCTQVPQADIPPIVPQPEEPPSGSWGACGSCDTCGFPAEECVTSPEGECLWDPSTCRGQQQPPPDGGDGQVCYAVSASIDMGQCFGGGSAAIDTAPNCDGGLYTPGTTIQAHAAAVDPKCTVQSWSGCGASGSGASVSFVPSGSCTVVAHMGY